MCELLLPREQSDAEEVVGAIRGAGSNVIASQADVGREEDVKRLMATVVDRLGGLDLLVNNTGIEERVAPAGDVTRTVGCGPAHQPHRRVPLPAGSGLNHGRGRWRGDRQHLQRPRVHPLAGIRALLRQQAGLKLLMQTAARELAPHKIRVLNIAPGAIVTPINQFVLDDPEARHAVEDEIPWGRMGKPEEIGAAAAWAASADTDYYVTGATVVVDGGMSLYPKFV